MNTLKVILDAVARAHRLSPQESSTFEKILERPPIVDWLNEAEGEELARRAALVDRLMTAPKRFGALAAKKHEALNAAGERRKLAEAALRKALAEEAEAFAASMTAGAVLQRELSDVERELRRTADARLERAMVALHALAMNEIRHATRETAAAGIGSKPVIHHNTDLVMAAMQPAKEARQRCADLQLQALSGRQVEAALVEMFDRINPHLARLQIPFIELRGGEVVRGGLVPSSKVAS